MQPCSRRKIRGDVGMSEHARVRYVRVQCKHVNVYARARVCGVYAWFIRGLRGARGHGGSIDACKSESNSKNVSRH